MAMSTGSPPLSAGPEPAVAGLLALFFALTLALAPSLAEARAGKSSSSSGASSGASGMGSRGSRTFEQNDARADHPQHEPEPDRATACRRRSARPPARPAPPRGAFSSGIRS